MSHLARVTELRATKQHRIRELTENGFSTQPVELSAIKWSSVKNLRGLNILQFEMAEKKRADTSESIGIVFTKSLGLFESLSFLRAEEGGRAWGEARAREDALEEHDHRPRDDWQHHWSVQWQDLQPGGDQGERRSSGGTKFRKYVWQIAHRAARGLCSLGERWNGSGQARRAWVAERVCLVSDCERELSRKDEGGHPGRKFGAPFSSMG
jgi:hypothetical protein